MAIADSYSLKLRGTFLGQEVNNIFYYRNSGVDGDAANLIAQFQAQVLPSIVACLASSVQYTSIEVVNEDDPLDFASAAISVSGERSSEVYDTFGAYGFIAYPDRSDRKAGGKRFPGVSEIDVASGIPTATQLARLIVCATALARRLGTTGFPRWLPAFKSMRCIKDPATGKCTNLPKVVSYDLWNDYAWKWTTTQNSRKRGVGI